jgi:hypothetical protein
MLGRWLDCVLYYSNILSIKGIPSVTVQPVMEAMVLILDLVADIMLQLQRDLPRTDHQLDALKSLPSILSGPKVPAAVDRLAKTAVVWKRGRVTLEELLLRQGTLLRWLGASEAMLLANDSKLVALTASMLLKQPATMGATVLTVDGQVARQVCDSDCSACMWLTSW